MTLFTSYASLDILTSTGFIAKVNEKLSSYLSDITDKECITTQEYLRGIDVLTEFFRTSKMVLTACDKYRDSALGLVKYPFSFKHSKHLSEVHSVRSILDWMDDSGVSQFGTFTIMKKLEASSDEYNKNAKSFAKTGKYKGSKLSLESVVKDTITMLGGSSNTRFSDSTQFMNISRLREMMSTMTEVRKFLYNELKDEKLIKRLRELVSLPYDGEYMDDDDTCTYIIANTHTNSYDIMRGLDIFIYRTMSYSAYLNTHDKGSYRMSEEEFWASEKSRVLHLGTVSVSVCFSTFEVKTSQRSSYVHVNKLSDKHREFLSCYIPEIIF